MPASSRTTSGSGEPAPGRDSPEPAFTAIERRTLLAIASAGVRAAVLGEPLAWPPDLPARLLEPAGAFVSLYAGEALRGCIGSVGPDGPLAGLVARLAGDAALRDPRFLPLQAAELNHVHLEVSVLSPPSPIAREAIDPKRHGVCLRLGDASAVLLPQVAIREGWDRSRLLAALCEKAGVPPGTDRDPAARLLGFRVTTVEGMLEPAV